MLTLRANGKFLYMVPPPGLNPEYTPAFYAFIYNRKYVHGKRACRFIPNYAILLTKAVESEKIYIWIFHISILIVNRSFFRGHSEPTAKDPQLLAGFLETVCPQKSHLCLSWNCTAIKHFQTLLLLTGFQGTDK